MALTGTSIGFYFKKKERRFNKKNIVVDISMAIVFCRARIGTYNGKEVRYGTGYFGSVK